MTPSTGPTVFTVSVNCQCIPHRHAASSVDGTPLWVVGKGREGWEVWVSCSFLSSWVPGRSRCLSPWAANTHPQWLHLHSMVSVLTELNMLRGNIKCIKVVVLEILIISGSVIWPVLLSYYHFHPDLTRHSLQSFSQVKQDFKICWAGENRRKIWSQTGGGGLECREKWIFFQLPLSQ